MIRRVVYEHRKIFAFVERAKKECATDHDTTINNVFKEKKDFSEHVMKLSCIKTQHFNKSKKFEKLIKSCSIEMHIDGSKRAQYALTFFFDRKFNTDFKD